MKTPIKNLQRSFGEWAVKCVKCRTNVLAVHSISHPPMSRNAVAKVLDVESTLKSGGEKATERSDKGSKNGHDENVQVVGRVCDRRDVPA